MRDYSPDCIISSNHQIIPCETTAASVYEEDCRANNRGSLHHIFCRNASGLDQDGTGEAGNPREYLWIYPAAWQYLRYEWIFIIYRTLLYLCVQSLWIRDYAWQSRPVHLPWNHPVCRRCRSKGSGNRHVYGASGNDGHAAFLDSYPGGNLAGDHY